MATLHGKKSKGIRVSIRPADIKNKQKREEVNAKLKAQKREAKDERKRKRKREIEELGEDAPPKQVYEQYSHTFELTGEGCKDFRKYKRI
jgi:formylmethanofuran dehydrogenase subunit E